MKYGVALGLFKNNWNAGENSGACRKLDTSTVHLLSLGHWSSLHG